MKHFYLFFCLVFSLFGNAQIINFPDANFKAKLLQANSTNMIALDAMESPITIDTNGNNEIEVDEALNVEVLIIDNSGISDLTGISSFTNLRWLRCSNNLLTTITIDEAITLTQLLANHNNISSVSVNFGNNMEGLDLSYNNLSSFAIENTIVWDTFNLSHNHIASLSLNNSSFEYFDIASNNLSEIQFLGNVWFFQFASFVNNQFSFLDLSQASFSYDDCTVALGYNVEDSVLFPEVNPPSNITYSSDNTFFDLGNFHGTDSCEPEDTGNVTIANCPNLEHVIFKNGFNHGYITCNEGGSIFQKPAMVLQINSCPSLNHLCVDGGAELPAVQARINQLGLQNQVLVDTNCISSVLGSEIFTREQLVISPVPAHNRLQILAADNLTISGIEIYNNLGQVVQKEIGNQQVINVSQLAKGSYYLRIKTNDTVFVKRFLKE